MKNTEKQKESKNSVIRIDGELTDVNPEILQFKKLKNYVLYLWLPLAIDIQGLSKVKDEKKEAYYNEIKKGFKNDKNEKYEYFKKLESFPNIKDFPKWKEIKEELNNGYKKFNPADFVKNISMKAYEDFDPGYLNIKSPMFLPNWLQGVVNILDKKIKLSVVKK